MKIFILLCNILVPVIMIAIGIFTLLITLIILISNKSDIINATTFLDTNNISVIMLEIELAIAVIVFISVEYILKKTFYKKIENSNIFCSNSQHNLNLKMNIIY